MDRQDGQDKQDQTLLHSLQSLQYKPLIIIDLLRISPLQSPHYIPLFEQESMGRSRMLADRSAVTVRSSRGLDLLRVCPLCRPSNRRSVPLRPPSGLGAESGDETRGVGTIWSVRQPCRGVSRLASTLGWPVRGVVQPLRWWLSGDTDAMWLDRCGEDGDRPFFHGLTEQLRSAEYQPRVRGRQVEWQAARAAKRRSWFMRTVSVCRSWPMGELWSAAFPLSAS